MTADTGLLTYADVAKRLSVSVRQVERYVKSKKLVVVNMGHRTKRFRPADVNRAIAKLAGDKPSEF